MTRRSKDSGHGGSSSSISFERFAASSRADFRFAPLNALLLVAIVVAGLVAHLRVHEFTVEAVALSMGSRPGPVDSSAMDPGMGGRGHPRHRHLPRLLPSSCALTVKSCWRRSLLPCSWHPPSRSPTSGNGLCSFGSGSSAASASRVCSSWSR